MIRKTTILRWAVRLALLALAGFLAFGGVGPEWLARYVPSLSPLASFASALAHRGWYVSVFWLIGPALMLLLAFWRGRFFCRWICPVGTLVSAASQVSFKKSVLRMRINATLFWIILASSLVGLPMLLWLDPLSTFQRVGPWVRGVYFGASLVPGLVLPALLVLSVFQPMVWCTHICPLGYGLELMQRIRKDKPRVTFQRTRRHLLIGLAAGIPLGILGKHWLRNNANAAGAAPILPPGAKDPADFAGTCIRCYACVSACPMHIIRPAGVADRAFSQWFEPEVVYSPTAAENRGYCTEGCSLCSSVCPTGAIQTLSLRQKRQQKIGTAEVIHSACLAWADNQYCMVCQEHCPYGAIDIVGGESDQRVPRPRIREDLCRGCGQCYHVCPAIRAGKAIRITGVNEQTQIDDGYADLFEEEE